MWRRTLYAKKHWLRQEFSKTEGYDFEIWQTTKPWIVEGDDSGADDWSGFAKDRAELSEFASIGLSNNNVLAISANAHMLAWLCGGGLLGSMVEEEVNEATVVVYIQLFHSLTPGRQMGRHIRQERQHWNWC
jgi:hypothetical protein